MKNINPTIILSLLFLLLFYFALWIGGFYAVYLLIFTGIIGLSLVFLIVRETFYKRNYWTSGIGILALSLVIFRPIEFVIESLKSDVVVFAFCEHTVTSVSVTLRKDKTFEYNAGAFLEQEIYFGTYKIVSDTVILSFDLQKPEYLGDTLVYKNNFLKEVGNAKHNDNFKLIENYIFE